MFKVSIIIPIYNVSAYVEKSILSSLNQTFNSIEYILIDDCSTDKSMDIVYGILNKHIRKTDVFIYKHNENRGLSAARNTGLNKATGDFIFFMDSDDEITPDCIELHYNTIIKSGADFTIANIQLKGTKSSFHIRDILFDELYEKDILNSFFNRDWNVSAGNKLYNRKFLLENKIEFTNGLLHEDILWSYELSKIAKKIVGVHKRTYLYYIHANSITTTVNPQYKIGSLVYIIEHIYKDAILVGDKIDLRLMNKYLSSLRFNTSLLLLNNVKSRKEIKYYYDLINKECYKSSKYRNLFSIILLLPSRLFVLLMRLPYSIYKKMQ